MKKIILFILVTPLFLYGQITFDKIPIDKQLVARDLTSNKGEVIFEGMVDNTSSPYDFIEIDIFREGIYLMTKQKALIYFDNVAIFNFNIEILAELANYKFEIYGKIGNVRTLEKIVDEIVAGDVYIIQGQSNAVAQMSSGSGSSNSNQSNFIRVFERGSVNINRNEWFIGQGDTDGGIDGNTGQWGLKLARTIVDTYNIPVAIFNGATGGKPISFFQAPNDYQTSLDSNYGKLYYRLNKTNLKNYVRAIFWSQGENTSGLYTLDDYKNAFLQLKNTWLNDYPNIEKFYIFQTKVGCTVPIERFKFSQESQRRLAITDPNIHLMSTTALLQNDGCHFVFTGGYEIFATRIFELVSRDLYNGASVTDIEPPIITNAYMSNFTSLIIETDANSLFMNLQPQDFQLNNSGNTSIINVAVNDSNIVLTLSEYPASTASISYFGPPEGITGNFITNSKGIELACFHEYPIELLPSSTTWNGSIWTNNIPPLSIIDAYINGSYNANDGNIVAKNLIVNSNIDFDNATNNSIVVYNNLEVSDGSIVIGDKESLVMYNDEASIIANITKKETTTFLTNIYDFTYYSSPVTNASIASVFSANDLNRVFYWDQSVTNTIPGGGTEAVGEWIVATGTMKPGKGYISEGSINGTYPLQQTVGFSGTPNNGVIGVSGDPHMVYNNDGNTNNDFNLVGNPYPSAIDADVFINEPTNNTIDGTLWFWTHNTPVNSDPLNRYTNSDYATYNLSGGTAAASGGPTPTGNIGSGQGFMVRAILDEPGIIFNNAMRLIDQNDQFFRGTESKSAVFEEKDRVWLNVESTDGGAFNQTLIGFFDQATDGHDRGYDGIKLGASWVSLYSKIDTVKYAIQGLGSFNIDKTIPIGFDTYINEALSYRINITNIEGVLKENDLYLIDRDLNITHDLKQAGYIFDLTGVGNHPDRFTLQFTKDVLGIDDLAFGNDFVIINEDQALRLRSSNVIKDLKVYDLLGRLLIDQKLNDSEFNIRTDNIRKGTILIVKATFENGAKLSKKAIKY